MKGVIPRRDSTYNIENKCPGTSLSAPAPPGTPPAFERASEPGRGTKPEVIPFIRSQTTTLLRRGLAQKVVPSHFPIQIGQKRVLVLYTFLYKFARTAWDDFLERGRAVDVL